MKPDCDLLIIGGGINGCGIARDAAGRGLSVCLAEMNDIGSERARDAAARDAAYLVAHAIRAAPSPVNAL